MNNNWMIIAILVIALVFMGVIGIVVRHFMNIVNAYKATNQMLVTKLDEMETKEQYYELTIRSLVKLLDDLVKDSSDTAQTQLNIFRICNIIEGIKSNAGSSINVVYASVENGNKIPPIHMYDYLCEVMDRYYCYDPSSKQAVDLTKVILKNVLTHYDDAQDGAYQSYRVAVDKLDLCKIRVQRPPKAKPYEVKTPDISSEFYHENKYLSRLLQVAHDLNIDLSEYEAEYVYEEKDDPTQTTETVDSTGATVVNVGVPTSEE